MTKKFRIWDGEKFYYEGCKISQNGDVESPWGSDKCDWVIQQWTGLLDKYGREIYEGDIVKIGDRLKRVEFKMGMFYIDEDYGDFVPVSEISNIIEVVNHIFQLTN